MTEDQNLILDKVYQELESKFGESVERLDIFYQSGQIWHVSAIILKRDHRNMGIGSAIMTEIVRFADQHGQTLILTPSTDYGATSVKRLEKFYSGFGFKVNRGKFKNYSLPWCGMYRMPN